MLAKKYIGLLFIIIAMSSYSLSSQAEQESITFKLDTEVVTKSDTRFDIFSNLFPKGDSQISSTGRIVSGPMKIIGMNFWKVAFDEKTSGWYHDKNIQVKSITLVSNIGPKVTIYDTITPGLFLASADQELTIDETLEMITTRFTSTGFTQIDFLKEETKNTSTGVTDVVEDIAIQMITSSFNAPILTGSTVGDFLSMPESLASGTGVNEQENVLTLFTSTFENVIDEKTKYISILKEEEIVTQTGEVISEEIISMITTFFKEKEVFHISIGDILKTTEIMTQTGSEEEESIVVDSITSVFSTYIAPENNLNLKKPESEIELTSAKEESAEKTTFSTFFNTYVLPGKNLFDIFNEK